MAVNDNENYILYHVTVDSEIFKDQYGGGYDTYRSMIVAASSPDKARALHPSGCWVRDVPRRIRSWAQTDAELAGLTVVRMGVADARFIKHLQAQDPSNRTPGAYVVDEVFCPG